MGFKEVFMVALLVSAASAQSYRVCVTQSQPNSICQSIGRDDSQVQCLLVENRVDCALKLAAGEAEVGFFSEEETILLGQQQPTQHRVIATVRDRSKTDPYAFEAVAIVPSNHTNGLEGLRGGIYCHPGLGTTDVRWSPRVLKTLEQLAASTDRCPNTETAGKTAEELEVETLNQFFSAACRPGLWSDNSTVDADLKSRYPNLCSLCGTNSGCTQYTIDMGVSIAGVRNDNRHIQALECLKVNTKSEHSSVAYVAWQHVREYFIYRNPELVSSYSVLCPNNTLVPLTVENLNVATSPCALVRQPWGTIVAHANVASTLATSLQTWWPNGLDPGTNTWQSTLFTALAGGSNAQVFFETTPTFPSNYTQTIRPVTAVDSSASCIPSRRWCVTTASELVKCNWVRAASHLLGLQPPIGCFVRNNIFECMADIRDDKADFIATGSNYGYMARQHYRLTPVKLVQNSQQDAHRVAAFVKETAAATENITRFENLRGRNACFPEYSGLAYMAFVRAGQERGVLSTTECDYARAVGEFFEGGCAPGAIDASHAISESAKSSKGGSQNAPKVKKGTARKSFNSSVLCSTCKSAVTPFNAVAPNPVCSWDYTNMYFGNNGSLACLADPENDVAFINTRNITGYLTSLGLQATQFRALCRNNTLALTPGVNIDDGCLLAYVVDAEVLTRRNDPLYNSLNTLFDSIDAHFGYTAAGGNQLINLEIFSPFGGTSDLLFKDTAIGLTEPTSTSTHEPARNYIELFRHLQACTGAAGSLGHQNVYSLVTIAIMAIVTRFVIV